MNGLLIPVVESVHVEEQAGSGPQAIHTFLSPDRRPSEAAGSLNTHCARPIIGDLAAWIACERNLPHNLGARTGVDAP